MTTESDKRIRDMKTILDMEPTLEGDYRIAEVFLKVAGEQLVAEKNLNSAFALTEAMESVATRHSDQKMRWYANHELAEAALKTGSDSLSAWVLATQHDRALNDPDPIVRGNASYYVGAIPEKHPTLALTAKNMLEQLRTKSTDSRVLHNANAWLKTIK